MAHDNWFVTRRLDDSTYLISEPPHVNSYLLLGSTQAVLFDTGMGISNIKRIVDGLTDLDLLVVNSHYHFDHSGGNSLFSQIAIHEQGAEPLGAGVPDDGSTCTQNSRPTCWTSSRSTRNSTTDIFTC